MLLANQSSVLRHNHSLHPLAVLPLTVLLLDHADHLLLDHFLYTPIGRSHFGRSHCLLLVSHGKEPMLATLGVGGATMGSGSYDRKIVILCNLRPPSSPSSQHLLLGQVTRLDFCPLAKWYFDRIQELSLDGPSS